MSLLSGYTTVTLSESVIISLISISGCFLLLLALPLCTARRRNRFHGIKQYCIHNTKWPSLLYVRAYSKKRISTVRIKGKMSPKLFCTIYSSTTACILCPMHRRRIDLEYKAKVVAYAWGAESLPR